MSLINYKSYISPIFQKIFPTLFWKRKLKYYQNHFTEIEMHLLPLISQKNKISIDIGGAHGSYTANLFDKSSEVVTFEPIPKNITWINNMIKYNRLNARVMNYALSDWSGDTYLNMVADSTGFSTIEKENDLSKHHKQIESIQVKVKQLDDFKLDNVGFIKIDVEGHEISVLNGAKNTIKNSLPNILVEIEERHKKDAVNSCVNILENLGYHCFFILNNKIKKITEFKLEVHQDETNLINRYERFQNSEKPYINNFIFIYESRVKSFMDDAQKILNKIN